MNHQILIVDDKEANIYALENMLKQNDRIFLKALSGNEALKIALKYPELSLILLDVQMPEMDGFEVAELLKANSKTAAIPIVFVTAISKESRYVVRGLEEGAIDYLFKPLDPLVTRAKVATLLKMVEQQQVIIQKNIELEKLNEEKNYLLGMAVHDLRNPLSAIYTFSEFMLEELNDEPDSNMTTLIGVVRDSSKSMLNIVNQLLDISKIEAGMLELNRQKVNLDRMLQKIIEINRMIASKKRIKLVYECLQENLEAKIDTQRMEQVVDNLLSNAIKYSEKDTTTFIRLYSKNGFAIVDVEDQGQGIAEEEITKLFKPFRRAKGVCSTAGEESTGLGLAIVKRFIEAHGGQITVKSVVSKGSIFSFTIPL